MILDVATAIIARASGSKSGSDVALALVKAAHHGRLSFFFSAGESIVALRFTYARYFAIEFDFVTGSTARSSTIKSVAGSAPART